MMDTFLVIYRTILILLAISMVFLLVYLKRKWRRQREQAKKDHEEFIEWIKEICKELPETK